MKFIIIQNSDSMNDREFYGKVFAALSIPSINRYCLCMHKWCSNWKNIERTFRCYDALTSRKTRWRGSSWKSQTSWLLIIFCSHKRILHYVHTLSNSRRREMSREFLQEKFPVLFTCCMHFKKDPTTTTRATDRYAEREQLKTQIEFSYDSQRNKRRAFNSLWQRERVRWCHVNVKNVKASFKKFSQIWINM